MGQSELTAVTAAGTVVGTATAVSASNVIVTAASSQTGVKLPSTASRTRLFFIQNSPSSTASAVVYPPTGVQFSGLSANVGITVPAGGFVVIDAQSSTYWGIVGTSFGSPSGSSAPSGFSLLPMASTGDNPAMASTDGTDATPVATEFYWAQLRVIGNCTITGVANFNGSVASGNIKVGLADAAGNILATSASTAMSGTDAYQKVAFTAAYNAVGPATYYALLFVDNGTARVNTHTLGAFVTGKATGQVYATGFTAFTPGTTFTTALGPIATLY